MLFVVQREHRDLFQYLRAHFEDEPEVTVLLDRRRGERRGSPAAGADDRRHGDRRTTVADTGQGFGYVLLRHAPTDTRLTPATIA